MNVHRLHSLPFLLAALLTMAAAGACVEPIVDEGGSRELTVRVSVPTADLVTKADVDAVENEGKMYDIRIWAFDHATTGDDAKAVGYGSATIAGGDTDASVTVTFPNSVNKKLDNSKEDVSVDIYVLANAASVGFAGNSIDVNRGDVRSAVISGSAGFGTACVSEVPGTGLPMAAYVADKDITSLRTGTSLAMSVALKRAVSKIRFVFAKAANMTEETEVTSIEINDMLPASTYLFPRESGSAVKPDGTTYEALNWTGTNGASLILNETFTGKTVDTPLRLRYDHQNSGIPNYEAFLDDEIEQNHAIQKILYLRESDQSGIVAHIHYKVGTSTGTADIAISSGAQLARNSWWTVYAYFMSFELGFQVTVHDDWDGYGAVNVAG
jgi:hypothetical protein